jgi:hypothetical protein
MTASSFTRENLFLKVLLEGQASLFGYADGNIQRYFYSLNDTVVNPLIYKEVHTGSEIVKNTDFRQQLWEKLKTPNYSLDQIKRINYTLPELYAYFKSYDENLGDVITKQVVAKKKSYLNLKITPGLSSSSSSLDVIERTQRPHLDFGSMQNFRIGLDAELNLPSSNYSWGVVFEPAFVSYKADATADNATASLSYSAVEFPVGLRYHMYMNENSRLFFNGFYVPGFGVKMDSKIDYSGPETNRSLKIETAGSLALGGGFEFKSFSMEARYYTSQNILKGHESESSDFNRFSIILGYRFMQTKMKSLMGTKN